MNTNALTEEVNLSSNGSFFLRTTKQHDLLQESHLNLSVSSLRDLYRENGYIWMKGLINHRKVNKLKNLFSEIVSSIQRKSNLVNQKPDNIEKVKQSIVHSQEYIDVCYSSEIIDFLENFLGGSVGIVKRQMIRYKTSCARNDTGAHYDRAYFRCGGDQFLTCWIPLGDITVEMGGLVYLENSSGIGQQIEQQYENRLSKMSSEDQQAIRHKGMGVT